MRPIKFRYVYKDLDGGIVIYHFTLKQIESGNVWETLDCCGSHSYELLSINQSTGLKDKNGNEIYEGDIIEENIHFGHLMSYDFVPKNKEEKGSALYQVVRRQERTKFELVYISHKKREPRTKILDIYNAHKIVGNIYENPELLNQ